MASGALVAHKTPHALAPPLATPTRGSVCRAASPRVLLAGDIAAMAAPGGGEIQLQQTARALADVGVDARLWRPWEDRFERVAGVHLFGSTPATESLARRARAAGKPVVLSPITWFDCRAMWHEAAAWPRRTARVAKWWLARAAGHRGTWRRRLYHAADALVPNSMAEATQLVENFRVPWQRLFVVPNGAEPRFACADPEAFTAQFGVRDFVLCAGRIEPRKNQATLLRALAGEAFGVVVLGNAAPGYEAYYDECRRQAGPNVTFISRIDHDDPLLASAYAAARCLALCSWFETPGLVALEAALSGTPLVLTNRGSAGEYFGPMATYVDPGDVRAIRRAVVAAFSQERDAGLAQLVRTQFTWQETAEATRKVYEEVFG